MLPKQAAMVFTRFGVGSDELGTPAGIKAARNRLMMARHTDHDHGSSDAAAQINAAYDVLKRLPEGYYEAAVPAPVAPRSAQPGAFYDRRLRDTALPPWQTDRHATANAVTAESYADANYVKRRLWELGGCSNDEYELFFYDGSFRRSIRVFASPEIYPEMAKAVIAWNGGSRGFGHRAVFARRIRDTSLLLIHLNGRSLGTPVTVRQDDFAQPLANDQVFLQQLPGLLAEVARQVGTRA
jgi:hypothetical protein